MRSSTVCYAIVLFAFVLTGYLLLRPGQLCVLQVLM